MPAALHDLRTRSALAALAVALASGCGSITDPAAPAGARFATLTVTRTPVLFVHGWNSSAGAWTTMLGRFKADGWTSAELASFSYNTSQSNATTAALIGQKVDSILAATGASRVAIVTHSMGALSARYYVRTLGGGGKVDALVSLGGPNHGTKTAYACFQTSCREMYPGSGYLAALNADTEVWGTPRYATWWSPCDEVVNPQKSTVLSGAANTQTACLTHGQLRESATVYRQVRDLVNRPAAAAVLAVR